MNKTGKSSQEPWDPRAYMQIASELRQGINNGTLPPGSRLVIRKLTDRFGNCQSTVVRALRLLSSEGLVRNYGGAGWYVSREGES